jgi:uncharacterized protein YdeI (YjbR/CyaY-like superfamily)
MPMSHDTVATFFAKPEAFANWLRKNHNKATELWVGYYKRGTGRPSLTWPESVREALRFGWIDGIRRSVDEESYRIRFTPRRPTSSWSQINIRFVEELIAEGRMEPAGLAAFRARKTPPSGGYTNEPKGGDAEAHVEREVKKNRAAWAFFQSQAPWYRRTCARWVMSAKKEQTRQRRLKTLIADSASQQQVPPLRQLQKKTGAPQQPSRRRRLQGRHGKAPEKKQRKKK